MKVKEEASGNESTASKDIKRKKFQVNWQYKLDCTINSFPGDIKMYRIKIRFFCPRCRKHGLKKL